MDVAIISLTCPHCGAQLHLTDDSVRFVCRYCGKESIVQRRSDIRSLAPVLHELRGVRTSVDRTASELAIVRLREEIPPLKTALALRQRYVRYHLGSAPPIIGGIVGMVLFLLLALVALIFSSSV